MDDIQKAQLEEAQAYCDEQDKSTEFMLQYMQDVTGLSFDTVLDYLSSQEVQNEQTE